MFLLQTHSMSDPLAKQIIVVGFHGPWASRLVTPEMVVIVRQASKYALIIQV